MAAGNSYLSEGHVVFAGDKTQPTSVEWTWRLPPDNTVLCFAEVWMKDDDATGVKVTLTSPSGIQLYTNRRRSPPPPACPPSSPGWTPVRLEQRQDVAASSRAHHRGPGKVAEHGDWKIKVTGIRQRRRGPCLCGAQRPQHGRAHGRQAVVFRRPQLGTEPFGQGRLQLCQWGVRQGRVADPSLSAPSTGLLRPRTPACTLPAATLSRMDASRLMRRRVRRAAVLASVPTSRCPVTSPTP